MLLYQKGWTPLKSLNEKLQNFVIVLNQNLKNELKQTMSLVFLQNHLFRIMELYWMTRNFLIFTKVEAPQPPLKTKKIVKHKQTNQQALQKIEPRRKALFKMRLIHNIFLMMLTPNIVKLLVMGNLYKKHRIPKISQVTIQNLMITNQSLVLWLKKVKCPKRIQQLL